MNDSVQLFEKQLSVVTKPIPKVVNPHDVVVKVAYSGVCGTDLHILSGEFPASEKAVTLGHEFSGIIYAIGSEVCHVNIGDRVVVNPNNNCHICSHCAKGNPHYCTTGGIRSTVGIWKNGGWANYCRVQSCLVYKIPDDISLAKAALIEPFSCIVRGWRNLGSIDSSSKVLVCGGGVIGLLWSCLLHHHGCRDIAVSELSEKRRTVLADLQLGLQVHHPDFLDGKCREALRQSDEEWGYDVIIDCTGAPKAIEQAFNWLRKGARFLVFGCCPKEGEIKVNPFQIYYKELKIIGSLINPYTFPDAISMVHNMDKYLVYESLGIKMFHLQDYETALQALKTGTITKAIFEVDNSLEK